jgi:hypothetical protein
MAKLTKPRPRRLLIKAGRQRNIDAWTERLHSIFASEQLRQPPPVEAAFGEQAKALIMRLDAVCRAVDHLAEATAQASHCSTACCAVSRRFSCPC